MSLDTKNSSGKEPVVVNVEVKNNVRSNRALGALAIGGAAIGVYLFASSHGWLPGIGDFLNGNVRAESTTINAKLLYEEL